MGGKKMKESRFNFIYQYDDEQALLYNSRTNALALLDKKHKEQFESFIINKDMLESEFCEQLEKGGYIIRENEDEISLLKYGLLGQRYRGDFLSLTIAATSDCNFRCVYCYKKNSLKNSKMDIKTQENLYKFVETRIDTISQLSICWYGGEPLLVMDIIENLSEKFIKLCQTKGVNYTAGIVTNGYLLTTEMAKKLNRFKVTNMQITIDGPEEIHNKRRPLAGGQGTFKKILQNVKACKDEISEISIRINTDKENMNEINRLISEIRSMGIVGDNVSYYLGFVESHNNCYLDEKCMTAEAFSKKHYEFMIENGISLMNAYPRLTANFCGADLKNSYVVDSEGYLYKCWNDVGVKEKSVGNLNADSLPEYIPNLDIFYSYMLYDVTQDPECKECKYLPICMGGCPFKRLTKGNRCIDKKYILEDYLKSCANYLISQRNDIEEKQ